MALLYYAEILARPEAEAVPARVHPWSRARRPRAGDAPDSGELPTRGPADREVRGRRDAVLRGLRDGPRRGLPDLGGQDRRRAEVHHEAVERRAVHLLLPAAPGGQAARLGRVDPRGAEFARR